MCFSMKLSMVCFQIAFQESQAKLVSVQIFKSWCANISNLRCGDATFIQIFQMCVLEMLFSLQVSMAYFRIALQRSQAKFISVQIFKGWCANISHWRCCDAFCNQVDNGVLPDYVARILMKSYIHDRHLKTMRLMIMMAMKRIMLMMMMMKMLMIMMLMLMMWMLIPWIHISHHVIEGFTEWATMCVSKCTVDLQLLPNCCVACVVNWWR